jgi:hypothetical protein
MKCSKCNGKGFYVIGESNAEIGCKECGGSGQVKEANRQDGTTPFNDENSKPVPDSVGVWFYHATRLPVHVIRGQDGQLYFQGGTEGEEQMLVSEFARIKERDEQISKFNFTKLVQIVDSPIAPHSKN